MFTSLASPGLSGAPVLVTGGRGYSVSGKGPIDDLPQGGKQHLEDFVPPMRARAASDTVTADQRQSVGGRGWGASDESPETVMIARALHDGETERRSALADEYAASSHPVMDIWPDHALRARGGVIDEIATPQFPNLSIGFM
ncbi:hypothetical protein AA0535_1505 [Asaia krungthepensis NRIC 0535]|uniref:Uncharacterized protein n=1 Tax=Asaia krungthepensis NRIC 0535 TaxID=1307925 RepID=A0ABQ0Q2J4_9PROT|nr:hypothetical protein AA0535_1505 [Asaia krungthepensis NRIC 0535]